MGSCWGMSGRLGDLHGVELGSDRRGMRRYGEGYYGAGNDVGCRKKSSGGGTVQGYEAGRVQSGAF